ncbi:OstA-like protein [Pedobacter nyackensis]|uniref:OstA-like protein n=1 Tax=Pedobacter nyackensis TaxID=475255 RepID=A0A1W2B854_9SPHI|nr:OstA-like protein [Pedobacter nyackensis]SMC68558.1 OstA-like protein [Pedobacter nyackensis]
MQKLRYFLILLLFPVAVLAQQKTKIVVESFTGTYTDAKKNISYLKKPVFRQDNATLTCDSAVFYPNENVFDAFRNVHINQGDTINIYSDRLNYNGNTKVAHLTNNVRMIDRESTLTTNILDYNMGSKIGTYVNGGKIVSKDVTLTSKNGYYFSNSRDAYFRYDVVVVTPESTINSDTLRYNTLTNWTYFYGPTNIKGKDDNLYTENGAYNTKTQKAYFGKKNLYTMGSKSLKGDSLYYDGIAGYGKAVRNIVFNDTTDKTVMYGQLGFYYKQDERTLVTKNPYVGMGTADSIKVNNKLQPDSLWLGADTLETQMVLKKTLTLISSPVIKKDNELGEAEDEEQGKGKEKKVGPEKPTAVAPKETAVSKKQTRQDKRNARNGKDDTKKPILNDKITAAKDSLLKDSIRIDNKAIPIPKDSLLISKADSLVKKGKDNLLKKDSLSKALKTAIPVVKAKADTAKGKVLVPKTKAITSVKDSVPFNPSDTVRTRVIKAYHNVRVYKANMQAMADSLFYTSADSTLRWYSNPILWSEGSQQTGDTIYLQLKNKKLNAVQVIRNAFLVNVNADSARYNQIKGRLITAFFKEGKLQNMFVDGNAESIFFNQNEKKVYTDMNQTVSSRIKILFKEKEIAKIVTIREPEGVRTPIPELKEDVFLTGFTWKPEIRPLSKKEVINGKAKAKVPAKKAVPANGQKTNGKPAAPANGAVPKGTTKVPTVIKTPTTIQKDSTQKDSTLVKPVLPKTELAPKAAPVKEVKPDTAKTTAPLKKQ